MKTIRRLERNFSMIDEPITYSIEKSQFQAWYRSGLIPKGNEFEDLVRIDTEQHVLKFSTGYGSVVAKVNSRLMYTLAPNFEANVYISPKL